MVSAFTRLIASAVLAWPILPLATSALIPRQFDASTTNSTVSSNATSSPITDLIVMGDSYSDSCNAYTLRSNSLPIYSFPTCPPPPLGRADQGRSWPEWIRIDQGQVESPGTPPGGIPINASQWNVVNLAQSGATCDNSVFPRSVFDIGQQISLYQTDYLTSAQPKIYTPPESTVLVMFIGTNDVTFIVNGTGSVVQETECIRSRLERLYDVGFRRFLMVENINLQNTPLLRNVQPRDNTTLVVEANNDQQARLFTTLQYEWNNSSNEATSGAAQIDVFPAYALFSAMYNNPGHYNFSVVDQGCNAQCSDAASHLWADALHPSSRAFHIFARKLVRFLQEGARGDDLIQGADGL